MKSLIAVKGEMCVDKWGPFSFSVAGKNPEARRAIADFARSYYSNPGKDLTTEHPDYRGLEQVDFISSLDLTLDGQKTKVALTIMPPHTLVQGISVKPINPEKMKVRGEFYCQYCGPLGLTLAGSNLIEQNKIIDWLKSYVKPKSRESFVRIRDYYGRGCLTIWFSNEEQTEADIKVIVMPSLQFIKNIKKGG